MVVVIVSMCRDSGGNSGHVVVSTGERTHRAGDLSQSEEHRHHPL